ncbi:MAG: hypothetical protein N2V75_10010 [Methanophagales archaeon]|nr:hypothetical protein [Methanophagales archaeon]RLG34209.1 MAG: hypothetical protein DRN97_03110 [Methanosarcinales archaeon]
MEEKIYELPIPRAITTGIIFEAAEKFGLEVDQEKPPEDAFDPRTDLPIKDYVPRIIIRSDSPEKLLAAKEYIYKKHEEWITNLEEWRKRRMEQIQSKFRK